MERRRADVLGGEGRVAHGGVDVAVRVLERIPVPEVGGDQTLVTRLQRGAEVGPGAAIVRARFNMRAVVVVAQIGLERELMVEGELEVAGELQRGRDQTLVRGCANVIGVQVLVRCSTLQGPERARDGTDAVELGPDQLRSLEAFGLGVIDDVRIQGRREGSGEVTGLVELRVRDREAESRGFQDGGRFERDVERHRSLGVASHRAEGLRPAADNHDVGIVRRHRDLGLRQGNAAHVLDGDREVPRLPGVEDAIVVAVKALVIERCAHEREVCTHDETLHQAHAGVARRHGTRAESALCESVCKVIPVLRVSRVGGGEQRIPGIEEGRVHRRELVARDEVALHPVLRLLEGVARVPKQGRVAFPQHRGPDLANVVDLKVVRTILPERRGDAGGQRGPIDRVLEGEGVLREVGRIGNAANPEVVGARPGSAGVIGTDRIGTGPVRVAGNVDVLGPNGEQERVEVAPSLAHAACVLRPEPGGIADQPVGDEMPPLMRHHRVVECSVPIDRGALREGNVERCSRRRGAKRDPIRLGDAQHRDGDDEAGIGGAHLDDTRGVVGDDHARGIAELRVVGLDIEGATAPVNENDFPCDVTRRQGSACGEGRRRQIDITGEVEALEAKGRSADGENACERQGRIDGE